MAAFDLDSIRVARPCKADWDRMEGDDRVRLCGDCRMNVYDLSALSADEARGLLEKHEGRICVRFWRRRDGKVLTSDCPVGVRSARRRQAGVAAGLAAAAGLAGGLFSGLRGRPLPLVGEHVMGAMVAPPEPEEDLDVGMGELAPPEVGLEMGRFSPAERGPR